MDDKKLLEMSEEEFRETLAELNKANREQADYAKRTWILSMISTISIVIVAAFIMIYCTFLIPKVNKLLNVAQASLENIEKVSEELSEADIDGLVAEVGDLIGETEKDLALTMEKIDSLDIEELNRAIRNLSDVIEPLAEFFGVLGGKAEEIGNVNVQEKVETRIDDIGSSVEDTIGGIGEDIQDSVENLGDSIENSIKEGIGNTFGKPAANVTKKSINKKK